MQGHRCQGEVSRDSASISTDSPVVCRAQVAEGQGGRLEDEGQAVEKSASPIVVTEDMLEELLGVSQCGGTQTDRQTDRQTNG